MIAEVPEQDGDGDGDVFGEPVTGRRRSKDVLSKARASVELLRRPITPIKAATDETSASTRTDLKEFLARPQSYPDSHLAESCEWPPSTPSTSAQPSRSNTRDPSLSQPPTPSSSVITPIFDGYTAFPDPPPTPVRPSPQVRPSPHSPRPFSPPRVRTPDRLGIHVPSSDLGWEFSAAREGREGTRK